MYGAIRQDEKGRRKGNAWLYKKFKKNNNSARSVTSVYRLEPANDTIFSSEYSIEKACQETFDLLSITLSPWKITKFPSTLHTFDYLPSACRHLGVTSACGEMQIALLSNLNIASVTQHGVVVEQCRRQLTAAKLHQLTIAVFHFLYLKRASEKAVISTFQNLIFCQCKSYWHTCLIKRSF